MNTPAPEHAAAPPPSKPCPARKAATLSVLDIGTSQIVCIVAQLQPREGGESLSRRSHTVRVTRDRPSPFARAQGRGGDPISTPPKPRSGRPSMPPNAWPRSRYSLSFSVSPARGWPLQHFEANTPVRGGPVGEEDLARVLRMAARDRRSVRTHRPACPADRLLPRRAARHHRSRRHDRRESGRGPARGLGPGSGDPRNLMLAVERCHLGVEAVVASPFAAGLSVLADDEIDMGAIVLDCGGGATGISVFEGGHLVHVDAFAVGGHQRHHGYRPAVSPPASPQGNA